jgi:hypothetical protein
MKNMKAAGETVGCEQLGARKTLRSKSIALANGVPQHSPLCNNSLAIFPNRNKGETVYFHAEMRQDIINPFDRKKKTTDERSVVCEN